MMNSALPRGSHLACALHLMVIFVSLDATAENAFRASKIWHGNTASRGEVVLMGDVSGDGREDIVTFVRGTPGVADAGTVYVSKAKSDLAFEDPKPWAWGFGYRDEVPVVGDFDGNGKTDIAIFTRGDGAGAGKVYVMTSDGSKFIKTGDGIWNHYFCVRTEIPVAGDFDGDGDDDIGCFVRDSWGTDPSVRGRVWVATSNRSSFVNPKIWQHWFAIGEQLPDVGDFNGDGADDIVAFDLLNGNVWVGVSNRANAFDSALWAEKFAYGGQKPVVGSFNGDNRADIAVFIKDTQPEPTRADILVSVSFGNISTFPKFDSKKKWHDWFSVGNELPLVGDVDADQNDDVLTFIRDTQSDSRRGDVYVAINALGEPLAYPGDLGGACKKNVFGGGYCDSSDLRCENNTCMKCGTAGNLCCNSWPGTGCKSGLFCSGQTCRDDCGGPGQPCCANNQCDGNRNVTCNAATRTCGTPIPPTCTGPNRYHYQLIDLQSRCLADEVDVEYNFNEPAAKSCADRKWTGAAYAAVPLGTSSTHYEYCTESFGVRSTLSFDALSAEDANMCLRWNCGFNCMATAGRCPF